MKCSFGHFIQPLVGRREPLGNEQFKAKKKDINHLDLGIIAPNPNPSKKN